MKVLIIAGYISRFLCAILLVTTLSGCIAAAVGVVSVTTIDMVYDRRSVGGYIDDGTIEATFKQYILRNSALRKSTHINGTSFNGIFLLTGEVPDENVKQQITSYATNIQGVRQIVDETRISGKTAFFSRTNDTWLTAKVKSMLLKQLKIDATRIKVKSEYGHVYLMGIVTPEEAEAATQVASSARGVVRVVKVFEYQS